MDLQISKNFSLKSFNSFGIDQQAFYFATFSSIEQLEFILKSFPNLTLLVLGGGSNILLTNDFPGVVAKNEIKGIEVHDEDADCVLVTAGAGENWNHLVSFCVEKNYGGLENLTLIPGNVGASPMQNIGAYGVEIKDVFHQLTAYDLKESNIKIFNNEDCCFGYRESVFKNKFKGRFVILNVTFRLFKNPKFNISYGAIGEELAKMSDEPLSIRKISQAISNIRRSKLPDPAVIGNAGSFFKNIEIDESKFEKLQSDFPLIPFFKLPDLKYKIPTAWLIEQCGWKGYREGDAGCHVNQPLVLVNYGNASGELIHKLAQKIMESVFVKFNIQLEVEVNII